MNITILDSSKASRSEKIELQWEISGSEKDLEILKPMFDRTLYKEDIITINYNIDINYFNNVTERLEKLLQLSKSPKFKKANMKILNNKICLIKEILDKIK